MTVLASVVLEDCRFSVSTPSLLVPPYALQATVLDIAQFLLYLHKGDPAIISQIGFALIPAFSTFPIQMQPRLLSFFDRCIIRGVLDDLRRELGLVSAAPQVLLIQNGTCFLPLR